MLDWRLNGELLSPRRLERWRWGVSVQSATGKAQISHLLTWANPHSLKTTPEGRGGGGHSQTFFVWHGSTKLKNFTSNFRCEGHQLTPLLKRIKFKKKRTYAAALNKACIEYFFPKKTIFSNKHWTSVSLQQCSGSVVFSGQSHPKEDNSALDFLLLTPQKECVRRRPDLAALCFEYYLFNNHHTQSFL